MGVGDDQVAHTRLVLPHHKAGSSQRKARAVGGLERSYNHHRRFDFSDDNGHIAPNWRREKDDQQYRTNQPVFHDATLTK